MKPGKRRASFGARWTQDVPWRGGTLIATGIHYRMRWAVMPGATGACGYVKVGLDHPWCLIDPGLIGSVDADVHMGLTYVDHEGWVGFDTGHAGDVWRDNPGTMMRGLPRRLRRMMGAFDRMLPYRREWTIPLVVAECRKLAGQAAEVRAIRRYRPFAFDDQEAYEREVAHERSLSFIGSRS